MATARAGRPARDWTVKERCLFQPQFYRLFITHDALRSIYVLQMHKAERPHGLGVDAIERWYVASLVPRTYDLKKHMRERRSAAKVLARRRALLEALARPISSGATNPELSSSLREPSSWSAIGRDVHARATAARRRGRADTPSVISVVESSAREVELQSLFDSGMMAQRPYQDGKHARVSYWRSVTAESTVAGDHSDLDSERLCAVLIRLRNSSFDLRLKIDGEGKNGYFASDAASLIISFRGEVLR